MVDERITAFKFISCVIFANPSMQIVMLIRDMISVLWDGLYMCQILIHLEGFPCS